MVVKKKIKVLLALFPLENHSRGIITVAGMLRDAGMEVILIGNELPERVIAYCGGELALSSDLMKAAEDKGIKEHTVFLLGGIFPPKNGPKLRELGFSGVFPPSSTKEEIISCIEGAVPARR